MPAGGDTLQVDRRPAGSGATPQTSLEPACQMPPPMRPRCAGTSVNTPSLPGNKKQPAGPTWKRRHSTASLHSAGSQRGPGRALDGKRKGGVCGGTAAFTPTPAALPPLTPRNRPALPRTAWHFPACLTLAAGGIRLDTAECGNWGALPNHAALRSGAGGHIGGGACMPGCGDAREPTSSVSAVPACLLLLPSLATGTPASTAQPPTAAASSPALSPFRPPPGADPRSDFSSHLLHLQRAR